MGTYNCNWIAFQTQYVINTKYPGTKHLFLHLPPRTSARILTQSISKFFQDNQLST
jgi:pyrrolidone-carboxylate peptidase